MARNIPRPDPHFLFPHQRNEPAQAKETGIFLINFSDAVDWPFMRILFAGNMQRCFPTSRILDSFNEPVMQEVLPVFISVLLVCIVRKQCVDQMTHPTKPSRIVKLEDLETDLPGNWNFFFQNMEARAMAHHVRNESLQKTRNAHFDQFKVFVQSIVADQLQEKNGIDQVGSIEKLAGYLTDWKAYIIPHEDSVHFYREFVKATYHHKSTSYIYAAYEKAAARNGQSTVSGAAFSGESTRTLTDVANAEQQLKAGGFGFF